MPTVFVTKIPAFLRGRLGVFLFTITGLAITITVACVLHQATEDARAQDFERRQNLRHAFLLRSLSEYEHSLFALRLVTENNQSLTPEEFQRAARDIRMRSTGIECVQWAPIVSTDALDSFSARVRALIAPDFEAKYRKADGQLAPLVPTPGLARSEHAILTYLHPLKGNENALGYDILTAPTAPSLERARRTLEITISPPLRLVQGFDGIILLCYARREARSDGAPESGPGYLQLVLNLRMVVQNIWNMGSTSVADFALYDLSEREPKPLYTHLANREAGERRPIDYAGFHTEDTLCRDISIGGRTWQACYKPGTAWKSNSRYAGPVLVLVAGSLLTLLSVGYLRLLLLRTERIRKEVEARTAELSESRAFLDAVIRQSPSSIWVKDSMLRFRLVNAEFCRAYARPAEEIIGQTDALLLAPETVVETEKVDREILASGETRHFEFSAAIRDHPRIYLVAKFPLHDATGAIHAVAGVATDITERRLAEAEHAAIERRLLETQKLESLGVLAGGIAHDFNNLLTGVLGHASLCRARLAPDDVQQVSLAQIEQSARRAAELCQQMLAYAGRGRFTVERIELGALLRDSLPLIRLSVSKRARLHFDLAPDLPPVEADSTQLRQIVINLVTNASESFGENDGDITLRTWRVVADATLWNGCVHSPDLPAGDYVCLEVSDTGGGIPAENLGRVFDPFFTTKFAGRGLGLAAVLGIVRSHGGALRVGQRSGGGSVFSVYLPVASPGPSENTPATASALSAAKTSSAAKAGVRRLLLVDDEAAVRDTTAALLRACGHEVSPHEDGASGLARFRSDPCAFSAAILDLTMPGLSGRELLVALREHRPDLPVLLISGYTSAEVENLLATPHTAFLAKPFVLSTLREKLSALLGD